MLTLPADYAERRAADYALLGLADFWHTYIRDSFHFQI